LFSRSGKGVFREIHRMTSSVRPNHALQ
jgi:hypothetical protein